MGGNERQGSKRRKLAEATDYFINVARKNIEEPNDREDFVLTCMFAVANCPGQCPADGFHKTLQKMAAEEIDKYRQRTGS